MSNYSVPKKVNESANRPCKVSALFALIFVLSSFLMANKPVVAQTLSLEQALQLAIQYDPLLKGNAHRKDRFNAEAEASSYWANPQVSASVQNLPTDGFAFDQEPMTQFKVGLKQQLPRGDENLYSQQKYQVMADQMSVESQARKAWLKREVTLTWLDWVYATRRIGLLDKEKSLLTQLLDFTDSRYSQGVGAAAQQDILQVRLALLSLDDKYVQAYQQKNEARSAFSKWFGAPLDESVSAPLTQSTQDAIEVDAILNDSNLSLSSFLTVIENSEPFSILQHHPEAMLLQIQTQIEAQNVNIAREQTKSQWAFEASYGYRQDAQNGASRADFVSLGVQVDLPFFNKSRQDASIAAAASKMSASETDFRLKVNELAANAEVLKSRLSALSERKALYETALIGETRQLSEAELTAYTTDTGDIGDVVNANLKQVQVQDDLLKIDIERARTLASLAYLYLPTHAHFSNKE
ncbi:TolC family protein [Alteromonas macleodii]|uniref:Outer membrane efflux family protein n=1 Tax=Alteromonas macleodii TaxID=28108 RepID=A0AB36FSV9_ALTMA|nr:TolC family protein [Alteromonas macleodii]OES29520.1 outer membrane efflux family protein [Alteromonas macleodii]OES29939.1 outer membrane efflux family protein [Alteromonas macleodii]OES30165.1 outer membrane efflux family protein [Alteromonas macleodii]OES40534.1 outer membrane efflux family protein [Alteromonas macleodii]